MSRPLKDILTDMRLEAENAIDNDFGFVSLNDRRRESEEHHVAMTKARQELTVIKAEIRDKEDAIRRLDYAMNALREQARNVSRLI